MHEASKIQVLAFWNISNNATDIPMPTPKIIASIGLNIPNIKIDFLVLAGIK